LSTSLTPSPADYDGKVTQAQIDELEKKRVAFYHALQTGSAELDETREAYQTYAAGLLIDLSGSLDPTTKEPPTTQPPKPTEGTPKNVGANTDPEQWKPVHMKVPPEKFKVVDNKGLNVATDFTTEANAQGYIDYAVWLKHNDVPPVPPGPTVPPSGDKDQFGILKIKKDKPGGLFETDFKLEEKIRNYASGKPSEGSVEYTLTTKGDNSDIEATVYEKINGFKTKESDSISLKLTGPRHSDGLCCWVIPDFETDGSGKKTLETEKPHPCNHGVNPKPLSPIGGSIIGKWIGYKGITYVKNGTRYVESWIHFPVINIDAIGTEQDKWRQYIPTTTMSKDYLKANGKLCTSRLDGTKKGDPPNFKYASLREISPP
jgi:hypothetical protein